MIIFQLYFISSIKFVFPEYKLAKKKGHPELYKYL